MFMLKIHLRKNWKR